MNYKFGKHREGKCDDDAGEKTPGYSKRPPSLHKNPSDVEGANEPREVN